MELAKRYDPSQLEDNWYAHWEKNGYFRSVPDDREPFTIVIPPPNVTGILHMGHMLNNTIQDVLIRKARMEGKNACWVPGTDHASIATEAKVVAMLKEKGIRKSDITREEFLRYAFEWKDKYGGIILDQLKKLGASCDWDRTRFTMEDSLSRAVIHVFVDLYRKGKIYRGKRMTYWDTEAKTVLSNEEVNYKEENDHLYTVRYPVAGSDQEWIVISTTRPETIMADTAIAVHPEDDRYRHLVGKTARVPFVDREVPILADPYVDPEFGTGALKITPAHDMNDFEIGQKHGLEIIDILTEDGKLNEEARFFVGMDRFAARKKAAEWLAEHGYLVDTKEYVHKVGRSERTDSVVEPRLTRQWFVDMKDFARTALSAIESGDIRFHPPHFFNMYKSWLAEDAIRDWCISRQLWWGQRIPAFYYEDSVFVAETPEEALALARAEFPERNIQAKDLQQDPDVLDTWFSSWLWPLSVFDGFDNPRELNYYYPTQVLVTAWDIIFFWVARMVMAGYEWSPSLLDEAHSRDRKFFPFRDVYFTGMVRDNKRRKMSKSLGNSPDALELIRTYGADGVRFGVLSSSAAGNDIIFDAPLDPQTGQVRNESKLCEQGLNFCNKLWNALRLLKSWTVDESLAQPLAAAASAQWFEHKLNQVVSQQQESYAQYRLSDAVVGMYTFAWNDFCSWYLEMIKPGYGDPIDARTYGQAVRFYEQILQLLHPFMPFVTEEIWHQLRERKPGEDCMISRYPSAGQFDIELIRSMDHLFEIISAIREARTHNGVKVKERLSLWYEPDAEISGILEDAGKQELLMKLGGISQIAAQDGSGDQQVAFLAGRSKLFLGIEKQIDVDAEREKLESELSYYEGFVQSISKKLENERFVQNAPAAVIEMERKKLQDGETKIRILKESLERL